MSAELSGPIPDMPDNSRSGEVIELFSDAYGEGDPWRYSTIDFITIVAAHWRDTDVEPALLPDAIEKDVALDNPWRQRLLDTIADPPTHSEIDDLRFEDRRFSTLLLRLERIADMPQPKDATHPRRAAQHLATLYTVMAKHKGNPAIIAEIFNRLPHPPPPETKLKEETPRRRR